MIVTDLESRSLKDQLAINLRACLLPEDRAHGSHQMRAHFELIEAEEPLLRVHDPVVTHHGGHEPSSESMAVDESNHGHRVREQSPPESIEAIGEVVRS